MRIFTLISLLLLNISLQAQNLIPNAGFEEVMVKDEYQWVQPQGAYYHYEEDSTKDFTHSGSYVNGICMYNGEANEYLHVKLTEPLVQGRVYAFQVYAKLYRHKSVNALLQKHISVYFGTKRLSTHVPGDIPFQPQLHLSLPDTGRYNWFFLNGLYTARGGEEYLTIGYFPASRMLDEETLAKTRYLEGMQRRLEERTEKKDDQDMAWLYLPPDQQKEYLKKKKKEDKKKAKKVKAANSAEADIEDGSISVADAQKAEKAHEYPIADDSFFVLRYYFDDFCLSPLVNGKVNCMPSETGEEELIVGKSIRLRNIFFATDESRLLEESFVQLNKLKEILQHNPGLEIQIHGHTDNQGTEAYNLQLSEARAKAVVEYLIEAGIDRKRLTSVGFGQIKPIATNDNEAGRTLNRRVEFLVLSK